MFGKVKFFNSQKGFGFIESQGEDYFVHITDVSGPILIENEEVEFEGVEGQKGLQAIEVARLNPPEMAQELGEVVRLEVGKGFGFVSIQGKSDVFFHFSDFCDQEDVLDLEVGTKLEFIARKGMKGRSRAYQLKIVEVH